MVIDKVTIINSREKKNIKYSRAHKNMFHDRCDHHEIENGPIAGRTRSRNTKIPLDPSIRESKNENPLSYTNIRGTPPQPAIPRRSTGAIVKRRSSKLALQRSDRTLRSTREKIRKFLATDDSFRDKYGDLKNKYYEQLYMLGSRTADGSLGHMPRPLRSRLKTDEAMEKEKMKLVVGKSKIWEMNRYWTEEELEEEFGIIPGRDEHLRDEELVRELYVEVQEDEIRRKKFIDYIARGATVKGFWKKVLRLSEREMAMVGRWVVGEVMEIKNRDRAVMDEKSVAIVRGVWEMIVNTG